MSLFSPSRHANLSSPLHRHGAQGTYDGASKATLENEFGTSNEDEVIKTILEKGDIQESQVLTLPGQHSTHACV